jgi:STE24 endopeptidase
MDRSMRRFLTGIAAGCTLGYTAVRAYDALLDLECPALPAEKDARAYGRERRRLMLAGMARALATTGWAAFALAPAASGSADDAERRSRRMGLLAVALVAGSVLDLPVDYVEDHVLERRYSLSKQEGDAWLAERRKALLVTAAVMLPLAELFVAVVRRAPKRWPLVVTLGSAPLLILANLIAPTFIMPLFNTFEPLGGALEDRLRALATRYGVGDAAILRVDMSRQTEKANAYVTGLFGTHRIVVGDTLLANFTDDEIEFVVAHELGHYVHRDVWRSVALGTAASAVTTVAARAMARRSSDDASETSVAALLRLYFFATVCGIVLGPLLAAASRSREWAADRFALAATDAPRWGVAAFRRLRDRNLSEDEQPRWMELLFSSHPSLRARIAALEAATL